MLDGRKREVMRMLDHHWLEESCNRAVKRLLLVVSRAGTSLIHRHDLPWKIPL